MAGLGAADLDVLSLALRSGGRLDAAAMEAAGIGRAGTGRALDALASLSERGLLEPAPGGGLLLTDRARRMLWDPAAPLRARLLGLLGAGAQGLADAAARLGEPEAAVAAELESMRRDGLALEAPRRAGGRLLAEHELLPAGGAVAEAISLLARIREAAAGAGAEGEAIAEMAGRAGRLLSGGLP